MYKYFNKVIYDDKKDLNISLKRLKDITKSNVFLIYEDNGDMLNKKINLVKKTKNKEFNVKEYFFVI